MSLSKSEMNSSAFTAVPTSQTYTVQGQRTHSPPFHWHTWLDQGIQSQMVNSTQSSPSNGPFYPWNTASNVAAAATPLLPPAQPSPDSLIGALAGRTLLADSVLHATLPPIKEDPYLSRSTQRWNGAPSSSGDESSHWLQNWENESTSHKSNTVENNNDVMDAAMALHAATREHGKEDLQHLKRRFQAVTSSSHASPISNATLHPPKSLPKDMDEEALLAEKRRRNSAASARFRLKKKQRDLELQRIAQEALGRAAQSQERVQQLERHLNAVRQYLVESGIKVPDWLLNETL